MLNRDATMIITGGSGMVGSAVCSLLQQSGFKRILSPDHQELDLCDEEQVNAYFMKYRPDYVFMIAAKVGGIAANQSDPVGFFSENLRIQLNLFSACAKNRPQKVLFLGSSCIYPRNCPQPVREEYLLTGPLESTNEGYALAKIAGLKLAQYHYQQHKLLTICPMPCNIYGTKDHFDLQRSHVLSALVRRFVDARDEKLPFVTLWGTGRAQREFIHVQDVAKALLFLMEHYDSPEIINVGSGVDISIKDLAALIAKKAGYFGETRWDTDRADGTPRKCLDISKLTKLGFHAHIDLEQGVDQTIAEYRQLKKKDRTIV